MIEAIGSVSLETYRLRLGKYYGFLDMGEHIVNLHIKFSSKDPRHLRPNFHLIPQVTLSLFGSLV